MNKQLAIAT